MPQIARYDYLIVGGGIAGVTAAEAIRQRDQSGSIAIISKENYTLYSRVLLPHYVRGKIDREKVFLRRDADYLKKNIDLFLGVELLLINTAVREVRLSDQRTVQYGKLLIATGGTPVRWRIVGEDIDRILRLQTIDDADRAREVLTAWRGAGDAIVVGGGFIALEFLESAVAYGYKAHLIIKEKSFFAGQLDAKGWEVLKNNFERHGIVIYTETEIKKLEENDKRMLTVHTYAGEKISGAWLGLGIGLEHNVGAFQGVGLKIDRGIVVNEFLETSVSGVWAAGDIAEICDANGNSCELAGNWNNAFLQGRDAGSNMAVQQSGAKGAFRAVSTYSINNLGYNITMVGRARTGEGVETIERVYGNSIAYSRFFMRNGVLVGAFLVNRFVDKPNLSKLIEMGVDVSGKKDMLRDPNYGIEKITQS